MGNAFLVRWSVRFRYELLAISGLSLASSLATLAVPWLVARLAGGVVGEESIELGQTLGLLALALTALMALTITVAIISEVATGKILASLRREIYAHVQNLPMSFHDRNRSGDVFALMTYCQRRSKIRPYGGAKAGQFLVERDGCKMAAASQPRFPNSWRLTGRFGPSGPNLDWLDQVAVFAFRARLCPSR